MILFVLSNLIFAQQDLYQKILKAKDSISLENLEKHIRVLENAGGHYSRVNFTPGNDSAAAYISTELRKIPNLSVEIDTFFISSATAPNDTKPLYNIVATLIGKKYPSQYYIIGAHLDCSASLMGSSTWNSQWKIIKAPGADDNATGVASLIEIARVLSDSTTGLLNDYSIRFIAFGAEESGPSYEGSHHGSRHFAEAASDRRESIPGMVSVDMIGYNNNYDYTSIVSNPASRWFAEKFYAANEIFTIGLITNDPPFTEATYSDHASFWESNYNAILLIENAPPWNDSPYYIKNKYYHKSIDTTGTVNLGLVRKVAQLTLCSIASLSSKFTDVKDPKQDDLEFLSVKNYPNPFNSSTRIEYIIPENGFVTISIYNILGEKIREVVNGWITAGTYSIRFESESLSAGIYLCEVQYNQEGRIHRSITKMNLLK